MFDFEYDRHDSTTTGVPTFTVVRAHRRGQRRPARHVPRRRVGARRDPGLEGVPLARLLRARRGGPDGQGRPQRPVLRQRPAASAAAAAQVPPPARQRAEGADLRPPRLYAPDWPVRPEDEQHRPAVHARRAGHPARRRHPPPRRRRPVRREPPPTRCRPVPLRLGVVASLGSAAWADFHSELDRSGVGFRLRVVDVRVQGEAGGRDGHAPASARSARAARTSMPSSSSAAAARRRPGHVRPRVDRAGDRRGAGARHHRPRPRGRPLGRRRGRAHRR